MNDLISKEKLKNDIAVLLGRNGKLIDKWLANLIDDVIDEQPTVDAEPVRHGHWIFGETTGHSWMKCSECCVSQSGQTATFTYCPNCGAKMSEEYEAEYEEPEINPCRGCEDYDSRGGCLSNGECGAKMNE